MESILMGMILHHYKTLVDIENRNTRNESMAKEIVTLYRYKPYSKELFGKTYDKGFGLINALHQDDREVLLNILVNDCNGLDEGAAKTIIKKDKPSINFFFHLIL